MSGDENQKPQEVLASETESTSGTDAAESTETGSQELQWYVVHTYSGFEQKAKLALQERIRQHKMEDSFSDILIPSENVIELVRGEKKTTSRKFFPGYMLVKMKLNDNTWHLVKNTSKIRICGKCYKATRSSRRRSITHHQSNGTRHSQTETES